MIDSLKPASAAALPCKICGGATALYGVVDFNKSCGEANGIRLPLSGVPIYYRRCANCEFLFTDAFDDWSDEQFKAHIYNDGYGAVDPDYETVRPHSNADVVKQLWGPHKAQTRVLDYGGGNDAFCAALLRRRLPGGGELRSDGAGAGRPSAGEIRGLGDLLRRRSSICPTRFGGQSPCWRNAWPRPRGSLHISTFAQPADFSPTSASTWMVRRAAQRSHSIFSRKAAGPCLRPARLQDRFPFR